MSRLSNCHSNLQNHCAKNFWPNFPKKCCRTKLLHFNAWLAWMNSWLNYRSRGCWVYHHLVPRAAAQMASLDVIASWLDEPFVGKQPNDYVPFAGFLVLFFQLANPKISARWVNLHSTIVTPSFTRFITLFRLLKRLSCKTLQGLQGFYQNSVAAGFVLVCVKFVSRNT